MRDGAFSSNKLNSLGTKEEEKYSHHTIKTFIPRSLRSVRATPNWERAYLLKAT